VLLEAHPAWPWLSSLAGQTTGDVLRLLVCLDVECADDPQAFHRECGLDAADGVRYECARCGLEATFPPDHVLQPRHSRADGAGPCPGRLTWKSTARVARPLEHERIEGRSAVGRLTLALVRANGPFARYYLWERGRIERAHPAWVRTHTHRTALRRVAKRLLSQLWVVWRTAEGLPAGALALAALPPQFRTPWMMSGRVSPRPLAGAVRADLERSCALG
jgi:hypothetical protein